LTALFWTTHFYRCDSNFFHQAKKTAQVLVSTTPTICENMTLGLCLLVLKWIAGTLFLRNRKTGYLLDTACTSAQKWVFFNLSFSGGAMPWQTTETKEDEYLLFAARVDYCEEKRYSPNLTLLFGLIETVFNFCFSPCSTIRDYLEEGSTSLPFHFTPIWQVKLVTVTSINDLSFFSENAKEYPVSPPSVTFPVWASVGQAVETKKWS